MDQSSNNNIYPSAGDFAFTREYDIDWEVVTAACLRAFSMMREMVNIDFEPETPGCYTFKLSHEKFGDFGIIEIRRVSNHKAEIYFSGINHPEGISLNDRDSKRVHMQAIIDRFNNVSGLYRMQDTHEKLEIGITENPEIKRLLIESVLDESIVIKEKKSKYPPAYTTIPEGEISESDRKILKMFEEGYSYKDIDDTTFINKGTVGNILSDLRKLSKKKQAAGEWGNVYVPYDKDRRNHKRLKSD